MAGIGKFGPTGTKTALGGAVVSQESLSGGTVKTLRSTRVSARRIVSHLAEASNRINQAAAWVGLDIVKDDAHAGAARL